MKQLSLLLTAICAVFMTTKVFSQEQNSELNDYKNFDFVAGTKILCDDALANEKLGTAPSLWKLVGGKALVEENANDRYISIKEYSTKISPILGSTKTLPDNFTIEYDAWLDKGYDGNPGIEVHFINGEKEVIITPNKHDLTVIYPQDGRTATPNPETYFGEDQFYNRWVHISIAYNKKRLTVYLDQYKQIEIDDCLLTPLYIILTGNTSADMPIYLKNFKLATGIPPKKVAFENGKFITHAIKFDTGKAIIKPESMSILNELVKYMKENEKAVFEIGGHTDSDGSAEMNQTLSQKRADAVKNQLIAMGIAETRLAAKGYGKTSPISDNTTAEGKANNRRVEFILK